MIAALLNPARINWKYIFGELLLLVAGILIALYINNLNEERKLRNFESKTLDQIEQSLRTDFEFHISGRIDRGDQIMRSADYVLRYLDKEINYHDSLETHFWRMNWIIIFEPQTIPFERLKMKGIENLSDENVRTQLLQLYDFTYPQVSYFTSDYNNWSTNRIEPFSLKHFEIVNLERGKGYRPIDLDYISSSVEYRNLINEKKSRTRSLIGRMKMAHENVGKLLDSMNNYKE